MMTTRFRWYKSIATTMTLAAVMALTAVAAFAKDDNIVLNPGTIIPATLNSEISSRTANAGDTFTATVDTSRGSYDRILHGATVTGYVKSVNRKSDDQPGMLDLAFTRLDLADGATYNINGEPTSLDSKNVKTDRDGMLIAKSTSSNRGLKFAGIGAGAGALVGVLATGGLSLWDTIAGAGIGYGASTINKPPSDTKNHDVDLQAGTQIGVLLGSKVTYYHRAYPTAISSNAGGPVLIGVERDTNAQDLPLPAYATPDADSMGLVAAIDHDITINAGDHATISTGLRFSIPPGCEVQIRPDYDLMRSNGLTLLNGPMTLDRSDHSVVRVDVVNTGQSPVTIHHGDRFARLVITQRVRAQFNESQF